MLNRITCVVSCCPDTYSGYGARSRDFLKSLIKSQPDWDIKVLSQRWGDTRRGFLEDHNEIDLISRIIPRLTTNPDIWITISVPNEFQRLGKQLNIGVTAGIETTICHPDWVNGCNQMDLILTSSKHSKESFLRSTYNINTPGQPPKPLQVQKPIEVLFEGVDLDVYREVESSFNLSEIKEDFLFLVTGHWMKGSIGEDRKNIGYTVKAFLETFKNKKKKPGLLLKTSRGTSSIVDQEWILGKIEEIKKTVKGDLPEIYLLHGDLSDSEMNNLYNHPKVKAMVSLTKGEGFGRPLLEFSAVNKPIMCSGWSSVLDFLNPEFTNLISGQLTPIHPTVVDEKVFIKEAQWFTPNDSHVGTIFKSIFENYKEHRIKGKRQGHYARENFSIEKMTERLVEVLTPYTTKLVKEQELTLPTLPKLKKIGNTPQITLPKLKK